MMHKKYDLYKKKENSKNVICEVQKIKNVIKNKL